MKLELRFQEVPLDTEQKDISSFISNFTRQKPETSIDCIAPVETAADKLSALIWRICIKDGNQDLHTLKNDPTIMQMTHDLSALKEIVIDDQNFIKTLYYVFEMDQGSEGSSKELSLEEMAVEALQQLENDSEYQKEYADFVDAVSYAPDDEKIDLQTAFLSFKDFINKIIKR